MRTGIAAFEDKMVTKVVVTCGWTSLERVLIRSSLVDGFEVLESAFKTKESGIFSAGPLY